MPNSTNQITWWKGLIILTFIISLGSLAILVGPMMPKYEYETRIIGLNNNNAWIDEFVIDYLCDDNVLVHHHLFTGNKFYASTWQVDNPDISNREGICLIKVRHQVK